MRQNDNRTFRGEWKENKIRTILNRAQADVPLMQLLMQELPEYNRTRLKSFLRFGHIRMHGVVTSQFDTAVSPNEAVELNTVRPFATLNHPRVKLIYEDEDIIIINKGYGLLSVGTDSKKSQQTAYGIVKNYLKLQHPANKLFIVHRLDRDTSGLMMFAKNIEAKETMQHNWNNMVISRLYIAVVEGVMEEDSGIIRSYLGETSQHEVYSTYDSKAGRLAVTRYHVLARGNGYTLVEFSLDTGRKNQIRIHAATLGHPIVGDRKYGAGASPIHRLALHARTLRFAHPATRRDTSFELPVPSRFVGLVKHSGKLPTI